MNLQAHLSTLESAGLIRLAQLDPDLEYMFRHALMQDAAYTSILSADRKRLHLSVGKALERLYPDRLDEYAATLALHFQVGGDDQRAHQYFILAGMAALAAYANREAEIQFRKALTLSCCESEEAGLLSGLGEALYRQSRFTEAIQTWRKGIDVYQSLGDHDGMARLFARSARVAWHRGDSPEGLRLSQEGLAAVAGSPDSPSIAMLLHEAARAYYFNGDSEQALQLCTQALDMAVRLEAVEVQADALATLGVIHEQPREEMLKALKKAVKLAETSGLLEIAVRANHNLGVMQDSLLGDLEAARASYIRAAEIGRQRGVASEEFYSLMSVVDVSLNLGEFSEVEAMMGDLEKLLDAIDHPDPYRLGLDAIRATLLWVRGEWEQALRIGRANQAETRRGGDLQRIFSANTSLAFALLEQDKYGELADLGEAEAALAEVIEIAEGGLGWKVWPTAQMGILRARQGRFAESREWQAKVHQLASERPSFWHEVSVLGLDMELACAEARWSDALSAAESLAGMHARQKTRFEWARALKDWSEILSSEGNPAELPRAQALLREALALFEEIGAQGYVTRVEDRLQDLRAKASAQALAYQKDAQELAQAGRIQASFLPEEIPEMPGWQLSARLIPAKETSGDFYDFIHLPDGRLGIVVADVADKGAAAALFMASSRTLLHTFALQYPTQPELVLAAANRRIMEDTHGGLFVTVFYAVLDPVEGSLLYCNAGHNPQFIVNPRAGADIQALTRTGVPLGIFEDPTWEQGNARLSPEEVLVLYTDGVTEAQNEGGEFFGEERLWAAVQASLGKSALDIQDAILEGVREFTGDAPRFDDITLVTLKRDADGG